MDDDAHGVMERGEHDLTPSLLSEVTKKFIRPFAAAAADAARL